MQRCVSSNPTATGTDVPRTRARKTGSMMEAFMGHIGSLGRTVQRLYQYVRPSPSIRSRVHVTSTRTFGSEAPHCGICDTAVRSHLLARLMSRRHGSRLRDLGLVESDGGIPVAIKQPRWALARRTPCGLGDRWKHRPSRSALRRTGARLRRAAFRLSLSRHRLLVLEP